MVRTLKWITAALLLLGCAALSYADPPERVGRLNYASGSASFAAAEAPEDWVQAVVNRPLTSGDRLWIDRDGRAEFHVGSTAVRVGAYTAVDVLNLDDHRLQLRLAEGSVNVRLRELDLDDIVEIATPAGAVLLREPGSYRISADPQRDLTRVVATFGQAEVVTPTQSFLVPSSQAAVVPAAGGPPSFEVAAYAVTDQFDRFSAERDRREDHVVSSRYVSRDMTGYEDLDQYGSWHSLPEYGNVWVPASVPTGWAPYRQGHWVWISPWGWTWVDDAPWGFAPFHYGRWVYVDRYWAWAPGPVVRRPVYAPALVAFVGGSSWSVSVASGPAVGWFPLGWHEPFIPWYRATPRYVQSVNVTHVTNVTNHTTVNYVNRSRPEAVTVVSQQTFKSSRSAWQERRRVAQVELARAEVIRDRVPVDPVRASFVSERPGRRPPAEVRAREVVSVNAPPPQATRAVPEWRDRRGPSNRPSDVDQSRVRVLGPEHAAVATAAPSAGSTAAAPPARSMQEEASRERTDGREQRAQQEAAARAQSEQRDRERRGRPQQEASRAQADAGRVQGEQRDRERRERAQQQATARAQDGDRGEGGRNRPDHRSDRTEQSREGARPPGQGQQAAPQPQPRSQQPRQPAGDDSNPSRPQRQQGPRGVD
jgi:hypothetical protein